MELRILEICKQKGITQKMLSQKTGLTETGISKALSGNPRLDTLNKIADALGVKITDLFANGDNKTSLVCPHCGKEINIIIE